MAVLVVVARLTAVAVAALVLVWALGFHTSFLPTSSDDPLPSASQLDLIYSVLHPLFMVIGFILLTGEAILAHRTMGGWSRGTRKSTHLVLQGAAFGFGLFGIWAKFRAQDGLVANFYSLHSWLGLLCLSLFASQWVVGFASFWHRGEGRRARATVLPWHVFLGLYTYGLAVATAETGLLEKLTFLQQQRRGVGGVAADGRRSPESMVVNGLGISLALLCGLVVFAALSPKHKTPSSSSSSNESLSGSSRSKDAYYSSNNRYHVDNGGINNGYHQGPKLVDSDGKWKLHA